MAALIFRSAAISSSLKTSLALAEKYPGRQARRFMRGINRTARYFGISTGFGCPRLGSAPRESFRQESERRVFVSTTIFTRATSPRATNYTTSTHFMGHFSAGLRLYLLRRIAFIRPEVHLFCVNNNQEFALNKIIRYGFSLGYSFGGHSVKALFLVEGGAATIVASSIISRR